MAENALKSYVTAQAIEVRRERWGDIHDIVEELVRADLEKMNSARMRDFRQDPFGVTWRDWTVPDVRKRVGEKVTALSKNKAQVRRLFCESPSKGYPFWMAVGRTMRTVVFGGLGYGIVKVLGAYVSPGLQPVLEVVGAVLAVGAEKGAREGMRAKTGNCAYGWGDFVSDAMKIVMEWVKSRGKKK